MTPLLYDIYINYANKDNEDGWVSRFYKILREAMEQLMPEKPTFLHYGNQEKPTAATLSQVSVMICVVSPNFASDINCIEDIEAFVEGSTNNVAKRIIKVVKNPIAYEAQPSDLKDLLAYNFYTFNNDEGVYQEIKEIFGTENEKIFWTQLLDVAQEAYHYLKRKNSIQNIATQHQGRTVFLAETTQDLQSERNLLKRELQKLGCLVLPDQNLPSNHLEVRNKLKKCIQRSDIAIHLIGNSYGEVFEENSSSLLELQNTLATEHSLMASATKNSIHDDRKNFSRIIWVAPYAKFDSEKQKVFVDNLRQSTDALAGAEILQVPLEDLKKTIRRMLTEQEAKSMETITHTQDGIYLIYDSMDLVEVQKMIDYLQSQGQTVLVPAFDNNLMEARKIHIDNLIRCKAAMIYAGKVSKQWTAMKLLDLLKAPGLGRVKPLKYKSILTSSVFQPDDFIRKNNIKLIELNNEELFSEIKDFLNTIV